VFPTLTPVAVPVIAVTTAIVSMVTFHALLLPFGMIKYVLLLPSSKRTVVPPVVKVSDLRTVKRDC
jgi:hypothetical protein